MRIGQLCTLKMDLFLVGDDMSTTRKADANDEVFVLLGEGPGPSSPGHELVYILARDGKWGTFLEFLEALS